MNKLFFGLLFIGSIVSVDAATTAWISPTANGTYSSWVSSSTSPKYTLVDETTCNGNVDYVSTHTLNARESYSVPLSSIPDGSIITAVYVAPCALQDVASTATSSLSMFSVVNGVSSSYAGTYFLKGTSVPSSYSYAYIPNAPVVKNASTKVEAGVVLTSGPIGGARLSRIATVVSYSTPAPTAPSSLVATKNPTNTTVTLTWNDNSNNETYFMVERSTNGTTFSLLAYLPTNTTRYTTSAQAMGTYYYRVRAYNSGGYSTYTNTALATVAPVVTIPVAPSNMDVSAASSTIYIYWADNSSNELGFVYEKSIDGVVFIPYGTTTNTFFTENNSAPGIYYYRVRAYNSAGYSTYSNMAVLSIAPQIAAPSAVTAVITDPNTPSTFIAVSWTDNSTDETGFMIERSTNGTTWTNIATTTYANVMFFGDSEAVLTAGTYYYRVRAYNALGYSAYSSSSAAVVLDEGVPTSGAPIAPAMLQSYFASSTYFIYWYDLSLDEDGFQVYKSNDGVTFGLYSATTTDSYFVETNITPGTYYYKVRAYNHFGSSLFSNITQLVIN